MGRSGLRNRVQVRPDAWTDALGSALRRVPQLPSVPLRSRYTLHAPQRVLMELVTSRPETRNRHGNL